MAATIELTNCKLQIRTKAGTLPSGKDKVRSVTLAGIDQSAEAQLLLDISGAVGTLVTNPVLETYRIDASLVSEGV